MRIEIQPVPGTEPGERRLVRPEPFGGTIAFRRPEMLVLVDHAWLQRAGHPASGGTAHQADELQPRAPFEAHLTLGHQCNAGCRGCYIDAGPRREPPLELDVWEQVIGKLAAMGVYRLALGGGESLPWEMLLSLAATARRYGMTPNLSTAGTNLTPAVAAALRVFERVHLSMDGTGADYMRARGHGGYEGALMSLRILRAYHPRVGANCVVSRLNADRLGPLFSLLRREGVGDIELLRFKPVGRGAAIFSEMDLTPRQAREFVPGVRRLARRERMRVRLDCSFAPMVCAAGYGPRLLARAGLAGCVGGSWIVSVDGRGMLAGCSFDTCDRGLTWRDLGRAGCMDHYLHWPLHAPEPCASCRWLAVCRGGCHVVARHQTGSFEAPDPGCPVVFEFNRRKGARGGGGR